MTPADWCPDEFKPAGEVALAGLRRASGTNAHAATPTPHISVPYEPGHNYSALNLQS